ncbi:MAG: hypothetical protein QM775_32485 [Pirellulales bacterium]
MVGRPAAGKLSYYASGQGIGVLAPKGWHCFGTYGSAGESIIVSPDPLDSKEVFSSNWHGLPGEGIVLSHHYGGTSGRFFVAGIIARLFPERIEFTQSVRKAYPAPGNPYPAGPHPGDTLRYKSKTTVEFRTPAHMQGIGTSGQLLEGDGPIDGVVMLVCQTPDVLLLAMRLPRGFQAMQPDVSRQMEDAAARLQCE